MATQFWIQRDVRLRRRRLLLFVCAEDQVKASELSVRPAAFQVTGTHLAGFQLSSFNLRSHQIYLEDEEYQKDIHMKDF